MLRTYPCSSRWLSSLFWRLSMGQLTCLLGTCVCFLLSTAWKKEIVSWTVQLLSGLGQALEDFRAFR